MNIYTPGPHVAEKTPAAILSLIAQHGSLEDLNARTYAGLNCQADVETLSRIAHSLDTSDIKVVIANVDRITEVSNSYGLPNVFASAIAVATVDNVTAEPYVVITDQFIKDGSRNVPYFEAVLYHEMVHIEQIKRGDLVMDIANSCYHWKGVRYCAQTLLKEGDIRTQKLTDLNPELDSEFISMIVEMDKPWELEAYARMFEYTNTWQCTPEAVVDAAKRFYA